SLSPFEKRMQDKDRRTSGQGLCGAKERGLEGERGNPRRGFLSGDETQALRLLLGKLWKTE
ncbi:MAG: hypothetical protein V1673_03845, partial [Candidatus Omnitrophota bacterium]